MRRASWILIITIVVAVVVLSGFVAISLADLQSSGSIEGPITRLALGIGVTLASVAILAALAYYVATRPKTRG